MTRLILAFLLCALLGLAVNRLAAWFTYKFLEWVM